MPADDLTTRMFATGHRVTCVATVSMVFPEDRLMAKMFNEEMAKFYEKYYENKGVTLIKGDTATGFEGNGKVERMFAVSTVLSTLRVHHCLT